MSFFLAIKPHTLKFKFDARTSRGAMQQHQVYYLKLTNTQQKEITGIGECAPLPGLSPELTPEYSSNISGIIDELNAQIKVTDFERFEQVIYQPKLKAYPALVFALETAWLDFKASGTKRIFQNSFSNSEEGIPINGLIWMGDKTFMQDQIKAKLNAGYACLKLKIGGLDFATELAILAAIRSVASAQELTIRLDANGAFAPDEALFKLEKLAAYDIHSLEQPIRAGQPEAMQQICQQSPIPVALDEELICVAPDKRKELLEYIKPPYIILKPTLLGGLAATATWIELAQKQNIQWWITSALESNIGLNAISQFTAQYKIEREQGLGTGQLYHNNIPAPLAIRQGKLFYDAPLSWDLSLLK